ncbi:MAG TPA: glycosyltransferase family 4 protein [Verrucomicrobiae bacterium]|nr:glycosyltransferase family 4 protein [Verrucomicrobiae bacterium]
MKLLFVHERLGSLGGAEANALITARELKGKGNQIALLHGAPTGKAEANWHKVFESRYSLETARSAEEAVDAALSDFKPDVVYVHKIAELRVIERLIESGLPLVRMVHDHDIYCMRSYKYFYRTREICERSASLYCVFGCGAFVTRNRAGGFPLKYVSYSAKKREIALNQQFDRMICVSNFMKAELINNGFSSERIEIFPPVPPPGDPTLRSTFSDRNLVIYAGQIIRGKGVDVLLESLALLKVPFECIILGEGSHLAYCRSLAITLGIADRVSFKGFVPQEELKNYYRECSVVALSSVWPEPIATIGLEVMRYALPVVGFDAGGVGDWLVNEVNGYLVPWMDKPAFASALERLLTNKERAREMGRRGLEMVNEKFDFATYIDGLEDLFHRVLRERRGRSGFTPDALNVAAACA